MTDFSLLLNQINTFEFVEVTNDIWRKIQLKNIDFEFNDYNKSNYHFICLHIPNDDKLNIKHFNPNIISLYKSFDMKLISISTKISTYFTIMNYDYGCVYVIKHSNEKEKLAV